MIKNQIQTLKILIFIAVAVFLLLIMVLSLVLTSRTRVEQTPPPSPQRHAYTEDSMESGYMRLKEKLEVSPADKEAKDRWLKLLNNSTGTVYKAKEFEVWYLKSADSFMVEISDKKAYEVKISAENWFKEQGVSPIGVCNLPVIFYLSSEVSDYFKENNLKFDSTPSGC
jgi:hypothetical protein